MNMTAINVAKFSSVNLVMKATRKDASKATSTKICIVTQNPSQNRAGRNIHPNFLNSSYNSLQYVTDFILIEKILAKFIEQSFKN